MGTGTKTIDKTFLEPKRLKLILFVFVVAAALVSGGGPLQVIFSKYFWGGRNGSGWEQHVFMAAAAMQIVLYLLAQFSDSASRFYSVTQWIAMILCVWQIAMMAQAYPDTFSFLGLVFLASLAVGASIVPLSQPLDLRQLGWGVVRVRFPYLALLAGLVAATWLIASCLIAQFFLYRPASPLTTLPLLLSLIAGAIISVAGVYTFHVRNNADYEALNLSVFPPLFVLLLALLRAKFPDGAFDTFYYKGTWPYLIADWRTETNAVPDEVLSLANFQEMFNALLRIIAGDYNPSLISTLSIGALFVLMPCSINLSNMPVGFRRFALAFATAIIFSLTESAMAQGTAYQEPFQVLLLTLALLNAWIWPIFAAGAIATKLTAVFAVLMIFVMKFVSPRETVARLWSQRFTVIGACAVISIFFAPQVDRNLIYSGRIFGITDTLAKLTDPAGPGEVLEPEVPGRGGYMQERPTHGILYNFFLSSCNMVGLDLFCDPTSNKVFGFGIRPSSRAPLIGLFLALAILASALVTTARSPTGIVGSITYIACYMGFLSQFEIGRWFVVLGFGCAILILCVVPTWLIAFPHDGIPGRRGAPSWILLLAFVPIGDLLTGIYISDGDELRRPLFARYETFRLDQSARPEAFRLNQPVTAAERFISALAEKYRKICPPPGLSPTVVGSPDSPVAQGPYLGVHVTTQWFGHEMRRRFFDVDIAREKNIPLAILAVVVKSEAERVQYTRSQASEFVLCYEDKDFNDLKIYCSKQLAPIGSGCAHSVEEKAGQRLK